MEFACKMLERSAVNETLRRELINHRTLPPHPNVIGFKEVSWHIAVFSLVVAAVCKIVCKRVTFVSTKDRYIFVNISYTMLLLWNALAYFGLFLNY